MAKYLLDHGADLNGEGKKNVMAAGPVKNVVSDRGGYACFHPVSLKGGRKD